MHTRLSGPTAASDRPRSGRIDGPTLGSALCPRFDLQLGVLLHVQRLRREREVQLFRVEPAFDLDVHLLDSDQVGLVVGFFPPVHDLDIE